MRYQPMPKQRPLQQLRMVHHVPLSQQQLLQMPGQVIYTLSHPQPSRKCMQ